MGRHSMPILDGWYFEKSPNQILPPFQLGGESIVLPHTWNPEAERDYYRVVCLYTRELSLDRTLVGKRLYLEFLGANSVCTVYLNQQLVGSHRGGYSTFRFDITENYDWNGRNLLAVVVDNAETNDVSPLFGDFTIFGGLYREVRVLAVPETHFDALYYGTQGIRLLTDIDERGTGTVDIEARISGTKAQRIDYFW